MLLILSCNKNIDRWGRILEWVIPCGTNFVFVTGDISIEKGAYKYDKTNNHIVVGCADNYDELSYKVLYGIRAVKEIFAPEYIVKTDDDIISDPKELRNFLMSAHYEYEGTVVTHESTISSWGIEKYVYPHNKTPVKIGKVSYCGGPMYYLGKRAIDIISKYMNPEAMKFEDVNVGITLNQHGILPRSVKLYTDMYYQFLTKEYPAYHDASHLHPQNA